MKRNMLPKTSERIDKTTHCPRTLRISMVYGESAANNKDGYNQCASNESNLIAVSKQR